MRKVSTKICSVFAVIALALSIFSCDKEDSNEELPAINPSVDIVSEDFPWFDCKKLDVDFGIDKSKPINYFGTDVIGVDDKYLVTHTTVF